jgi:pyridoxal phosphate enzyme (YggS family)
MNPADIPANIAKLHRRVSLAAEKIQKRPEEITVLAVSKTRPAQDIRIAHDCGLTAFGENYVQEALEKIATLSDLDLSWHFIGPIQSNKTQAIATHFHWVHSIDRLKIARRLSDQRPPELPPLQVCLQVNISGEDSKSGVAPAQLAALAEAVLSLPRLQLRGLMAIPAATTDTREQHRAFAALRELLNALNAQLQLAGTGRALDTLSMGMSADLEAAIAEGSTLVRVGTDLFGQRQ